jgi:hypothetical protein
MRSGTLYRIVKNGHGKYVIQTTFCEGYPTGKEKWVDSFFVSSDDLQKAKKMIYHARESNKKFEEKVKKSREIVEIIDY